MADKRVLRLIRRYLQAGVMVEGVKVRTEEGTPQGGPLSPRLANILLDELDRDLEERGHRFVRYADDCNVYVRSERAGQRVMSSVKAFLQKRLRLKVNEGKSAVARPQKRKFLGFSFYHSRHGVRLRLAPETADRVKARIRELTRRTQPMSLAERIRRLNSYLQGWLGYFARADAATWLGDLEGWMRRRLRACLWKQWKRPRTRLRELRALGLPDWQAWQKAMSRKGPWRMAGGPLNGALGIAYWRAQGLMSLTTRYRELRSAW